MNQFVLDTNVIISAHLIRFSQSRKAFDMAFEKGLVIYSNETFEELTLKFVNPKFDKYISLNARMNAISEFERRGSLIQVTENLKVCRDSKDDKFISLAVTAGANCIISGDSDLLFLHPFRGISIITPSAFINEIERFSE